VKWLTLEELGAATDADLSLHRDDVAVQIGHLAEDDHRRAFVECFRRVVTANEQLLAGAELEEVRAHRLIGRAVTLAFPGIGSRVLAELTELGGSLYDCGKNRVDLVLRLASGRRVMLGVGFDEPTFSLVDAP
jgi:hypothetical protein